MLNIVAAGLIRFSLAIEHERRMKKTESDNLSRLPSVDEVLKTPTAASAIDRFGRTFVVSRIRGALAAARADRSTCPSQPEEIASQAMVSLETASIPSIRPVFNLTGTILHTNLGRAVLADTAAEAALTAMRTAVALEFDLESGRRGERDDHLRGLLRELTGAEDAIVVNNNAAAVLLVLNSLAKTREAIVSRGELIEIGGSFRMPEIMSRAGARLVEVGTTNRTHLHDYRGALGPRCALILKVHTSNYRVEGFTAEVGASELSALAREHGIPLVHDLGSGTLIDLARFGLPHEPTVSEAVANGADLVTFSGDKLLGGPQAGFIVGKKDLVTRINRNPMKRALRVDKIRLAALEATLRLYRDPDRLAERLPTVRTLARSPQDIEAVARRLLPVIQAKLGERFTAEIVACSSQIGSGALPLENVPSKGIAIRPLKSKGQGQLLSSLAAALRRLPVPVIGRISNDALVLDLRCLDDEAGFAASFVHLNLEQSNERA
jgi:L-seryl-tRNA(Ser) seleniumtransferase